MEVTAVILCVPSPEILANLLVLILWTDGSAGEHLHKGFMFIAEVTVVRQTNALGIIKIIASEAHIAVYVYSSELKNGFGYFQVSNVEYTFSLGNPGLGSPVEELGSQTYPRELDH